MLTFAKIREAMTANYITAILPYSGRIQGSKRLAEIGLTVLRFRSSTKFAKINNVKLRLMIVSLILLTKQ